MNEDKITSSHPEKNFSAGEHPKSEPFGANPTDKETVLAVQNLSVCIGEKDGARRKITDGISYEVREGEILGIVGESGCGKTTVNLAVMDLLPRDLRIYEGSIYFQKEDLTRLDPKRRREISGRDISMIYQEPLTSLNPLQRIGRQIEEPLLLHCPKMSAKERRQRALKALEEMGFQDAEELYRAYPHQLSGGMRQRVCIAMATICRPKLLIADEPTTALDVTVQAKVLRLLKHISRRNRMSVIFISHDLAVIGQLCDRVLVMYAGKIMEEGPVESILQHPAHEYTKGLMRSIPKLEDKGKRLHAIGGRVPAAGTEQPPCPFAGRCSLRQEICLQESAPEKNLGNGHVVYCHACSGAKPDVSEERARAACGSKT